MLIDDVVGGCGHVVEGGGGGQRMALSTAGARQRIDRGRDAGCPAPAAQIRTCANRAPCLERVQVSEVYVAITPLARRTFPA
jgi:hypothetical protein